MAKKNQKMVEEITAMDVDFAQWYTDICKKAELVSYTSVKGCMVIRPYGYAIWENIQRILDAKFKETGHVNVNMPMFIPESLLQKEKDHVEGFAPEVAWVTYGGSEKLEERLCVRPTSETLFCDHYKDIVHSYRDLPKLYNQWVSVVRWEKTTRPFLRSREFLWQEGHTIHATAEEAIQETERMLNVYADFCEKCLAMPVVKGRKTESDKFAGAVSTYAIEALMHDGKALQAGTSHYFGDGFAKAFGIQFAGKDNKLAYPHQTSWGMTTRLIGAIIMTHGDDSGLVLPPAVAPVQAVIVPIAQHKEGVLDKANELYQALAAKGIYTGVTMMPLLPLINDTRENVEAIVRRAKDAGASYILPMFGVTLRSGSREHFHAALERGFPGLKARYEACFGNRYECFGPNCRALDDTFRNLCAKLGIATRMEFYRPASAQQQTLF